MSKFIARFRSDEAGAVTVDWVVLTAAVVALAVGVSVMLLGDGEEGGILAGLQDSIGNAISTIEGSNEGVEGVTP